MSTTARIAIVRGRIGETGFEHRVARYLPANYEVLRNGEDSDGGYVLIGGVDRMGWTFADYVQPRLASGLWFATEVRTISVGDEYRGGTVVDIEDGLVHVEWADPLRPTHSDTCEVVTLNELAPVAVTV